MLGNIWSNPTEAFIQEVFKEAAEYSSADWEANRDKVAEHFKNKFNTQQVKIGDAIQAAKEKRMNAIILSTKDGLDIVGEDSGSAYEKFEFNMNHSDDQLARINDKLFF